MTPVIHILDSHASNQIAAGEVVERPASVVKELVENSLDAGAKHIDITIEGNGVPLIRVRDDGCGIGISDLPMAIIRHATSKISKIEDLDDLRTLGFRGEALPSIASVSRMDISSRTVDEVVGVRLVLNGGEQEEFQEVGCPVGTSVTVRNLFFNTPARLKFLKSTATEFGLISDTVGRISLARPDISFSLSHPQQIILQTSGRGDLRETIGANLGHTIARQLIPIKEQRENWLLEGYISPPELVRSSKQAQIFMINGRIVRSSFLSRALEDGYHTLIPIKLHPIAVLHLHVEPSDYDVNVHPTKMDVRFKNEQVLASFISQSVYQSLIDSKPLPSFQTKQVPATSSAPVHGTAHLSKNHFSQQNLTFSVAQDSAADSNSTMQIQEARAISETENIPLDPFLKAETPTTQEIHPEILSLSWPIAQLFNTYILATDGEILLMIDQHAAHERINYERLLSDFKKAEATTQGLLIPIPMEFTLQEEQVLLEHLWVLTEMGFIMEQFGAQTYLLRGVPSISGSHADSLLRQFIEEVLLKNSAPTMEKLLEEWIYLLACKESIKGNDPLSLLEMEQLIAKLSETSNPYTCPHGRPTMIKLTRTELERRFYRT